MATLLAALASAFSGAVLAVVGVALLGVVCLGALMLRPYVRFQYARGKREADGLPVFPDHFPRPDQLFAKSRAQAESQREPPPFLVRACDAAGNADAIAHGCLYLGKTVFPYAPWRSARIGTVRERISSLIASLFEFEIYLPAKQRREHVLLYGPPGGGKTVAFISRWLADAAATRDAFVVADVKGPELANRFVNAIKASGRDAMVYDPFCAALSNAWEPIYGAAATDTLAKVSGAVLALSKTTAEHAPSGEPIWKESATDLLNDLLRLSQFWPMRYQNLHYIVTLAASGVERIRAALAHCNGDGRRRMLPTIDEVRAAVTAVVKAHPHALLDDTKRPKSLTGHLWTLERATYSVAEIVRQIRTDIGSTYLGWGAAEATDPEPLRVRLRAGGEAGGAAGAEDVPALVTPDGDGGWRPLAVYPSMRDRAASEALVRALAAGTLADTISFRAEGPRGMAFYEVTTVGLDAAGAVGATLLDRTATYADTRIALAQPDIYEAWDRAARDLKAFRDTAENHLKSDAKTFASTLFTLAPSARKLRESREVGLFLSRCEIRPYDLLAPQPEGRGAPILFLGASNQHLPKGSAAIAQAMTALVIAEIAKRAGKAPSDPTKSNHTVHFILDEFANLKLDVQLVKDSVTLMRGWGASMVMALQHYNQGVQNYGENDWKTIHGSTRTHQHLPAIAEDHAKRLVEQMGQVTVTRVQKNGDGGKRMESREQKPLMDLADVTSLRINGRPTPAGMSLGLLKSKGRFALTRIESFYENARVRQQLGMAYDPKLKQWLTASEWNPTVSNPNLPRYPIPSIVPGSKGDSFYDQHRDEPITSGSHLLPSVGSVTSEEARHGKTGAGEGGLDDRTRFRPRDEYWVFLYYLLNQHMELTDYDPVTGRQRQDAPVRWYELKHPDVFSDTFFEHILVSEATEQKAAAPRPSQPTTPRPKPAPFVAASPTTAPEFPDPMLDIPPYTPTFSPSLEATLVPPSTFPEMARAFADAVRGQAGGAGTATLEPPLAAPIPELPDDAAEEPVPPSPRRRGRRGSPRLDPNAAIED